MFLPAVILSLLGIYSVHGDVARLPQNVPNAQPAVTTAGQRHGPTNIGGTKRQGQVAGLVANMSQIIGLNSLISKQDGDFTAWTTWSNCPEQCGRTALRSRERYCTNPPPSNGGKNCQGARFQLKLCQIQGCPEDNGFTEWSKWSKCSKKCGGGVRKRTRQCNKDSDCAGKKTEIKHCNPKACKTGSLSEDSSIVDVDPQTVCGYNPCEVAKCSAVPYATCVSDFKCQPVFFDADDKKIDECTGDNLYLNVSPESVCRFNPCKFSTCLMGSAAKCVVNTKCHPVYLGAFGKKINCKAVLKVPAKSVCGLDPCEGVMCKDDPAAKCLVNHKCKPIFIDTIRQKIHHCSKKNRVMKTDSDEMTEEEETEEDSDGKQEKDGGANYDEEEEEEEEKEENKMDSEDEETNQDQLSNLSNHPTAENNNEEEAVLEKYTATASDDSGNIISPGANGMNKRIPTKTEDESDEDEDSDDDDEDDEETEEDESNKNEQDDMNNDDVMNKLNLLKQRLKHKHHKHKNNDALKRISIESIASGTGSSIIDTLLHVGERLRHEHEKREHTNAGKKHKIVYI